MSELLIRAEPYGCPDAAPMIAQLQDYYRALYGGPDESPVDPSEFAPPNGAFFVGSIDETPVAMGGWRRVEALPELGFARPAEIKRMYVADSVRGRGLARQLLAHLELIAHDAGCDGLVLSTGRPQVGAIALYRSCGYVDVAKFGYFARYDAAVHLGKPLSHGGPT